MSLKKIAGLIVFCVTLGSPFAAYSAGASGDRLPTYIEVLSDGSIIIEGGTAWNNPDNCGKSNRIVILPTNQFINQYYAAALTAYSTENYLWAWLDGCWTAPWGAQFPKVVNAATRFKP